MAGVPGGYAAGVSRIGEVVEQRAVAAVEGGIASDDSERSVQLVLPPDTRLVRLARLLTSGVAASAGFDVEEVEDLRIAVDEVCASLIERGGTAPLRLRFVPDDGSVLIEITRAGISPVDGAAASAGASGERARLSEQILAVVVDDLESDVVDGEVRYRMRKWHVAGGPDPADPGAPR